MSASSFVVVSEEGNDEFEQFEHLSERAKRTSFCETWDILIVELGSEMMTSIGPFEIRSLLGTGGMGEVYRAHDTRLGRDVAIKILPSAVMRDPDRLARFEREARVLASLNHPHVGAIYGLEEAVGPDGVRTRALILELIEGETLAEYIARTATLNNGVPLASALDIARQIVDGLDGAHERGIVHRDLKPANVKITPAGVVKILDFGLAKSAEGNDESVAAHTATLLGTIIGTPAYMSPEQARGQATDKRTDIWAFGCVLYELLTGRRAFSGASISDTVASVLDRDPDWAALPSTLPAPVVSLLRRCLEKNPRLRLRDIGDADLSQARLASSSPSPESRLAREVHFQRLTDFGGMKESPAISPDGKMVAFVAMMGGRRQIWIQLLAGGRPLQITHDDVNHEQPRWAPDSSTLIYYAPADVSGEAGMLYEISALGGHARPITASAGAGDVSHAGDRLAFFLGGNDRFVLVTSGRDGSNVTEIATVPPSRSVSPPRWSPDHRSIAFHTSVLVRFDERLYVVDAHGRNAQLAVVSRAFSLKGCCWLPDSATLVYSSGAGSTIPYPPTLNLRMIAKDGTGDRQVTFGDDTYIEPDVHPSGKLVACRIRGHSDIWRFPLDGSAAANTRDATQITRQTGQVQTPSVSPDGRELVYLSDSGGHGNLWIARIDGTAVRQLTFERDPTVTIGLPLWSPVSNNIVFVRSPGNIGLSIVNADGRGLRSLMPDAFSPSWSLDGTSVYYLRGGDQPSWCVERVALSGGDPVVVRNDGNSHAPTAASDALYFARRATEGPGWRWEICRDRLDAGQVDVLAQVDPSRIPVSHLFIHAVLSPDGRWLAMPLIDGATCNVWLLATDGHSFLPVTDYGERPTMIARHVAWSPDSRFIYAAVAHTTSDVVLLDGLVGSDRA